MALHLQKALVASTLQCTLNVQPGKKTSFSKIVARTGGVSPATVFEAAKSASSSAALLQRVATPRLRTTALTRASATEQSATAETELRFPRLKEFLEDCKGLGRVRAIVNTGLGILEWVTTIEEIVYSERPGSREFASIILQPDRTTEFHILLNKVAKMRLAKGKSARGDIPTYSVRFVDSQEAVGATMLLMWKPGSAGQYDPGQVEAFEALLSKYGEEVTLYDEGSEEASEL